MADTPDFAKFVPGFDFLQNLIKNAGRAVPDMGQWIAPTLDPDELAKRIEQLRTVQFWLEQNARMLATTVQALEVQRMTLSTLKTMDMPLDRMREAFTMRPPAEPAERAAPEAPARPAPAPAPEAPEASPPRRRRAEAPAEAGAAEGATPAAPGADPMQWWNALTQQFTELAAQTLKETTAGMARNLAAAAPAAPAAEAASAAPQPAPAARTAAPGAARKTARKTRRPAAKRPA